ncbi:prepilin-type N-terminal cleavage/methylation domain-containing protein [bacterium]|nr:prepilin-type N-terminal cleavage/methylation domain-containing protein [bacterium]
MKRHAFTLIELLIVVAIIGILAAIAVPNFLNAQLRAKVARCQSDLKAIGMGLEQYNMDQGYYPPSHRLWLISTPVAYVSSVPRDVFPPPHRKDSGQPNNTAKWTWYRYMSIPQEQDDKGTAVCADYYAYFPPFAMRGEASSLSQQNGCPARAYVKSFGPNAGSQGLWQGDDNGDDFTLRYDASNGLKSYGDIAVFVPGNRVE